MTRSKSLATITDSINDKEVRWGKQEPVESASMNSYDIRVLQRLSVVRFRNLMGELRSSTWFDPEMKICWSGRGSPKSESPTMSGSSDVLREGSPK